MSVLLLSCIVTRCVNELKRKSNMFHLCMTSFRTCHHQMQCTARACLLCSSRLTLTPRVTDHDSNRVSSRPALILTVTFTCPSKHVKLGPVSCPASSRHFNFKAPFRTKLVAIQFLSQLRLIKLIF